MHNYLKNMDKNSSILISLIMTTALASDSSSNKELLIIVVKYWQKPVKVAQSQMISSIDNYAGKLLKN